MNMWTRLLGLTVLATVSVWWVSGCGRGGDKKDDKVAQAKDEAEHKGKGHKEEKDHKDGDHKEKDHKEKGHKDSDHKDHKKDEHHYKPLTLKDIKIPASFKTGVVRLEELHKNIHHLIEHKELPKVHRVAEEMALVSGELKKMARKDVEEDHLVEVGRLCNEIAGYFPAIDEAADAGKQAETTEIHRKMGKAIEKLKTFSK